MNRHFVIIVICFLMVLLTAVSNVSANDMQDNITISQESEDTILTIDSTESFTDLNDVVTDTSIPDGEVITLENNYTYTESDSQYKTGIVIDRDITIDGKNHTIDGANQASIFNIQGTPHVILKNIKFVNAYTLSNGAAVNSSSGNLKIENCIFINNTAELNGGAIYIASENTQDTTLITDSTFSNNTANLNGGAIYASETLVNITSSSFDKNVANVSGGSVFADYGVNVNHSIFEFETASFGGALYISDKSKKFSTIENSSFTNCTSTGDGGAAYINASNVTVKHLTFTNNTAGDDGGALYWEGDDGIIYNITCTSNKGISVDKPDGDTSSTRGGTICLTGSNIIISNSSFIKSSAYMDEGKDSSKVDGGALFVTGNNVIINDTVFVECNATNNGGALYVIGNNTKIIECDFLGSYAKDGSSLYVDGNDCKLYNSTFTNNIAGDDGGAIYWEGDNGILYNITCSNNKGISAGTSNSKGGTICLTGSNVTVDKSSFTLSTTTVDGGALFITGNDVNVYNTTFDKCTSTNSSGGALYIIGNNTNVIDCEFTECVSDMYGGVVYIEGNNVTISNSNIIQSLTNNYDGGALYIAGMDSTIDNCNFSQNKVLGDEAHGGSIAVQGNGTNITNCIFDRCSAYEGGALYLNGSNIEVSHSSSNRTFAENGGAIYIAGNDVNITDFNSTLSNATSRGGAIYVEGNNVNITSTSFRNTIALIGGAIFIAGNDTTVDNSLFRYNTGSDEARTGGSGGAVYIEGEGATVSNSDFAFATVINYGGAIAVWGANANIMGNVFDNCSSAKFNGGAIYVAGDNATISDSNFTRNKVNKANFAHGGAIDVEGHGASILNCNFEESEAYVGGIIYVNGHETVINGSTFKRASAFEGGAIYVAGTNATISKSDFSQISADSSGGAVYVAGSNTYFDENNFTVCTVKFYHGGAIYILGVNTTINNTNFISCTATGSESRGGAIDVEGNDTSIHNSHFDKNTAKTGGAIYVFGHRAVINNTSFEKDTANNGGAIYVLGFGTSILDSNITDCNSTQNGGAIDIEGDDTIIEGTSFESCNSLRGAGGSIYIAGSYTNIGTSNFTKSTATTNGGAILVAGDYTNIYESNFDESIAKGNTVTSGGGAIYISGKEAHISDSNFTDNKVTSNNARGGTIYIEGYKATIDGSYFNNSYANLGGIIYIEGEEATIDSSVLSNSSSRGSGGAIYVDGNNATISGSEFENIKANGYGGAIYVAGEYTDIDGSSFYNCTVSGNNNLGGAIYINDIGTTISYSNFTLSYAAGAGAIYIKGDYTSIDHCNLNNNSARSYAGAIHVSGDNTMLSYNNFTNNIAIGGSGGALDIGGQNASVFYSYFDNNDARLDGGAINWEGGHGDDSIVGCVFTNNNCNDTEKGGGAVYWTAGSIGDITAGGLIKDSIFINNTASGRHGGAVDWFHALDSVIDNCTFIANHATADGGALYTGDQNGGSNNLTISNSRFYNNNAAKHGGAISNQMHASLIYNCTFDNNAANFSAGTILMKEGNADNSIIDHCYIYNSAVYGAGSRWDEGGGAISIGGPDTNITISNVLVMNSSGVRYGGAISVKSANSSIINVTIINSSSTDDVGGAIYWSGAYGTLDNVKITNSSSNSSTGVRDVNGGAVYWVGSYSSLNNLTIHNSSATNNFAGNSRNANGGAIYLSAHHVNMTNIEIINSSALSLNGNANGGAIYTSSVYQNGYGNLVNATIENSHVYGSTGGAICWNLNYGNAYNVTITNSSTTASANNKDARGGAIYWTASRSNLDNITISGTESIFNYTDGNGVATGGAIYVSGVARLNLTNIDIDDSTVIANNGKGYGGAIYRSSVVGGGYDSLNNVSVSNSNLYGTQGGAVAWYASYADVNNISIVNSSVTSPENYDALGGALYWNGATSNLKNISITNSSVNYNHETGTHAANGGAVFVAGDSVALFDVTVKNSSAIADNANAHGGAIHNSQANFKLINASLSNTFANGQGGAIYLTGTSPTMDNISIVNSSTEVVNNTGRNAYGGAIYTSIGTLKNVLIINSSATDSKDVQGGAIYYTGSTMNNITVINASAISHNGTSYGGAVSWIRGSGTNNIYNSSFENSTADLGGAIYWNRESHVYNTSFINNSAVSGGAVYTIATNTFHNATFENNRAENKGGAVYASGVRAHFYDSTLKNNTALYGGAIYYYNHPTGSNVRSTIQNTDIINNTAFQGSGIYATRLRIDMINSTLLDNQAHANEFLNKTIGVDANGNKYLSAIFIGYDNLLNGIWDNSAENPYYLFTNVTYWGVGGRSQTGKNQIPSRNDREVWIDITVEMYDKDGNYITEGVVQTDANGMFKYNFEADYESNNSFRFYHVVDRYYTNISDSISNTTIVKIIVDDIFYGENATVKLNLTDGALERISGNVTVTFNDTRNTTITIEVINGIGYCNNVSGLEVGTYRATANYAGDLTHLGDVDWYTFRVIPIVDLAIEKEINVTNRYVNVSDIIKYTVTVTNNGPCNATSVNVTEVLSEYLYMTRAQATHGYYNQTGGYWYIDDLKSKGIAMLTITARVIHVGTISNFVFVSGNESETNYTNNNATARNVTALPIVDVEINKEVNVTAPVVNVTDKIKFTITVVNHGPCNASGVYVNETLSPHLKMISATTNVGTYDNVTWVIGDLNTTFTATLTIVAEVISNGTISNAVIVTSAENDTNKSNNHDNITNITALNIVDLSVNKDVNTSVFVNVTDKIKFTITVHNNGPCDATNVNVTEVLSPHLKLLDNVTDKGHYDKDDGIWYIGDLANGSTVTLTLVCKVISNGTISNVVVVTSSENDTNKSNNEDNITNITALPIVDLQITKEANTKGPVNVTDIIRFTITVKNNGPNDATNVTVVEVLNNHLKLQNAFVSSGYGPYDEKEGIWHVGTLQNQSSAQLIIEAKVISNGTIANVVTVTSNENDTNPSNNNDTIENITALPIVDVSITKTVNVTVDTLNLGDLVKFTVNITNNGPCNATGVYVSEILDSSLIFVSSTATKGQYDNSTTWNGINNLNVGETQTLTIIARVAYTGEIENEVIIYCYQNDTNLTNNRDNISKINVSDEVDLAINKTASTAGPVNVSDIISFTITVYNIGGNNASGVYVAESLDSHLKMVNYTLTRGTYNNYTWVIGNLEKGGSANLTIWAKVISAGNISNAVTVTGYDNDTNMSNNKASIENITALPIVDLEITKTANVTGNYVNVTNVIEYTITVKNNGPCDATNVTVNEVLSNNLKLIGNYTDYNYYNVTTGVWYIGELANGSQAVLKILVEVIEKGTIANVVNVTSHENDTNESNNKDDLTLIAVPIVDLQITKTSNITGTVNVTNYIKFTITVTNNGPCNATNVNVSEILSDCLNLTKNETEFGYYNKTTGIWHIGDLANGSTAVLNITAQVIKAGTIDNVVIATSDENDTDPDNNKDELIIEAVPIVDVSITKEVNVSSSEVDITDLIKFTITVHNAGPCNATGVNVSEVISPALKFINYTSTAGKYNVTEGIWYIGNSNVGDTENLTIVARVEYSGVISNEVIVTSNENDTNLTNNKASISELISFAHVDLEIIKKANVTGAVNVTDYVEFTINVTNHGPCNASGVYVEEILDSHLRLHSYNATEGTTYDGRIWNIGYLNNKEIATLKIVAQVISNGTIANVVVVTSNDNDTNKSNNNDSIDNITALPIVDLQITKTTTAGKHVNVTDIIQFTVTVTNNGPSDATNVTVNEVLSQHLKLNSLFVGRGSYNVTNGVWYIGTLENHSTVQLIIEAQVISNGTIENIVNVTGNENDTNTSNNNDSIENITAFNIVDIGITKSDNITSGEVEVGDLIEFTLVVTNYGPCNATNVYIKEVLDSAVRLVRYKFDDGEWLYSVIENSEKRLGEEWYDGFTWKIGDMTVGEVRNMTIVVRTVYSGILKNNVTAYTDDNDTDLSNNFDSISDIVSYTHVDLQITKEDNITSGIVNVTDYIEFTINVTNNGPANTSGVFVKEALDPNLILINATPSKGTYDGTYTWNIGYLNNGETATLKIVAQVMSAGIISNEVIVDGFDEDIHPENNNASIDNITALPIVDLEITKTVDGQINVVRVSDIIQFTINVFNHGPCGATNVTVNETLSPHLNMLQYLVYGGDYDVESGIWYIGDLANQAFAQLIIQAQVISNGTISNAVDVTSDENDTNESNNHDEIDNITALPLVDLEITKEVNVSDVVYASETIKYTITLVNNGPSNATKVNVSEVLSSNLKLISASGDGYYNETQGYWFIGNLNKDSKAVLTIVAQIIRDGIIDNYVRADSYENDSNPYNNWDEVVFEATPLVDVSVNKTVNVTSGKANVTDLIEFTITIHNAGPSNASGVYVVEILDSHLRLVSYYGNGTYDGFSWVIGDLNNGSTETLTIIAEVISEGMIDNEVIVHAFETDINETNDYDNISSINATAFVDLTINKTVNVTSSVVNITDLIKFTIIVKNNGPSNASDVMVSEVLNEKLEIISNETTRGRYEGDIWTIGNLGNGENATLIIIAKAISLGNITNTVNVTSSENDTNVSNNEANITNITVLPIVDVTVNKTVLVSEVNVGDNITYIITVHNNGPSNATNVNVFEKLSNHVTLVEYNATKGNYSKDENIWYIGKLVNGSTQTLTLIVKVTESGIIENSVQVTSDENDTNLTNNNYTSDNVTAKMIPTPIDLHTYDITYGEDEILVVTLPGEATGTVNITVGKRTYDNVPINNGVVELPVIDLGGGNYNVTVVYGGNGKYMPNATNGTFNVAPIVPIITIEVEDIWVGEVEILNVTVNAPGTVFVTVNGVTVEIPLENGVRTDVLGSTINLNYKGNATWNIWGLPVGPYPAFALYPGNENYTRVNTTDLFHVRDLPSTVNVTAEDIYVGEDAVINISVGPEGVTGSVTVNVEGKNYTVPFANDRKATLVVPDLKAGQKNVTVWYNGTQLYRPSENTTTFNVLKVKPPVDVESPDITVGDDGIVTVTVPQDATGTITIEIEGVRYTAPIGDGEAIFFVPGLEIGEHDINAYYSGDDKYLPANATGSINVNPLDEPVDPDEPDEPESPVEPSEPKAPVGLEVHETGNPIILAILMLLSLGCTQLRRLK